MLEQIQSNPVTAVLIARIQNKKFCFDINDVQTIINPKRISPSYKISQTKKIVYDSAEIQIIDFAAMFALEQREGIDTRIIVLNKENQSLAFFVDEINELISFNYASQEKLKVVSKFNDNPYLIGQVYISDRSFLFPNINQLFNDCLPESFYQ